MFLIFVLLIIGLFAVAWTIHSALKAEMRLHWRHVHGTRGQPPETDGALRTALAAFLNGDVYSRRIARPVRVALEAVAVVLFVALLLAVASRFVFVTVDGLGGVCEPGATNRKTELNEPGAAVEAIFRAADPCFSVGVTLKKGETYTIDFTVAGPRYAEVPGAATRAPSTRVETVDPAPWHRHLLTPFRRHLLLDWYQVVARVDDQLFDRHPLFSAAEVAGQTTASVLDSDDALLGQTHLRATITPRRDGELYLYLNDVLLFLPWQLSHDNNAWTARVMVKRHGR